MVERTRIITIEMTVIGNKDRFASKQYTERMLRGTFPEADDISVKVQDFDMEVTNNGTGRETDMQ